MPRPILSYLGSLLASDPNTYFDHPQTDGGNVCCIIFTGTNSLLVFLTTGATLKIADYPIEYLMNNGWMAYTRDAGTGQYQVWRRSPEPCSLMVCCCITRARRRVKPTPWALALCTWRDITRSPLPYSSTNWREQKARVARNISATILTLAIVLRRSVIW